jgi:hypothetical protein
MTRRRFVKGLIIAGSASIVGAGSYSLVNSLLKSGNQRTGGGNGGTPGGGGGNQPPTIQQWSTLRGACYRWQKLTLSPDQPPAPDPSVTFPLMKSLGFNLARVDNMDWNYMDKDKSAYQALLQEVGRYADSNGVACIYHFGGGNSNMMPRSLTALYPSLSAFYSAWWNNEVIPSGEYGGLNMWEASFQGLWKPLIETVNSYNSTLGYGLWNEPTGLPNSPGPLVTLHNYYEYLTQRIRSVSSGIVMFQVTSNGGGDEASIKAVAPSKDLGPYGFEGHMYSLDPVEFAGWAQGVSSIGGYGLLGEWHVSPTDSGLQQDITSYLDLVKEYGFATTWYSWTCGGGTDLLQPTSCQPTNECSTLSSLYQQILGPLPT